MSSSEGGAAYENFIKHGMRAAARFVHLRMT